MTRENSSWIIAEDLETDPEKLDLDTVPLDDALPADEESEKIRADVVLIE